MSLSRFGVPLSYDFQSSKGIIVFEKSLIVVDVASLNVVSSLSLPSLQRKSTLKVHLRGEFVFVSFDSSLIVVSLKSQRIVEQVPMDEVHYASTVFTVGGTYVHLNQDSSKLTVNAFPDLQSVPLLLGKPSKSVRDFTVVAKTANATNPQVHSQLTVASINANVSSIVAAKNLRYVMEPIQIECQLDGLGGCGVKVDPTQFFEGFNMTYEVVFEQSQDFKITAQVHDEVTRTAFKVRENSKKYVGVRDAIVGLDSKIVIYRVNASSVAEVARIEFPFHTDLAVTVMGRLYLHSYQSKSIYGYDNYLELPVAFGSWSLAQPCLAMKSFSKYLFCNSASVLQIFTVDSSGSLSLHYVLNSSKMPDAASLDIVDFSFGESEQGKTFVYLLDRNLGLVSFRLDLNSSETTVVLKPLGSPSDLEYLCSSADQLIAVHANGNLDVYSVQDEVRKRTIKTKRRVWDAVCTQDWIALKFSDSIAFIDPYASSLSAVVKVIANEMSEDFTALDSKHIQIARKTAEGLKVKLEVVTLNLERPAKSKPLSLNCTISVQAYDCRSPNQEAYVVPGHVSARNALDHVSVRAELRVVNNCQVVAQSQAIVHELEVRYNDTRSISLEDVFTGNNVTLTLSINNLPAGLAAPAVLVDSHMTHCVTTACSSPYYGMAVAEELMFVTTQDSLLVYSASDMSVYDTVALELHLGNSTCFDIQTGSENNHLVNLFSSCLVADKTLVVMWTYDTKTKKVISVRQHSTPNFAVQLKAFITNTASFIVLAIDSNHHLMWVDIGKSGTVHEIDMLSLELDSFYAAAVEAVLLNDYEAYFYVADMHFGLRVLQLINTDTALEFSIPHKDPLVSLGLCGTSLFAGDSNGKVFQYDVSIPQRPRYVAELASFEPVTGRQGSIKCSAMGKYVAVPVLLDSTHFGIRVIQPNTTASFDLSVSPVCNTEQPGSLAFVRSNVLIGLSQTKMQSYLLRKPAIEIPAMTLKQYQAMLEKWGTNHFELNVQAANRFTQLNSSNVYLTRSLDPSNEGPLSPSDEGSGDPRDDRDEVDPRDKRKERKLSMGYKVKESHWLVWSCILLVGAGLLSLAAYLAWTNYRRKTHPQVVEVEISRLSNSP
jgi:hypothetical protein